MANTSRKRGGSRLFASMQGALLRGIKGSYLERVARRRDTSGCPTRVCETSSQVRGKGELVDSPVLMGPSPISNEPRAAVCPALNELRETTREAGSPDGTCPELSAHPPGPVGACLSFRVQPDGFRQSCTDPHRLHAALDLGRSILIALEENKKARVSRSAFPRPFQLLFPAGPP